MSKTFKRLGTSGYETSVANEDVLKRLVDNIGWTTSIATTSLEFLPKADCVVEINGLQSTVTAGAELSVFVDDVNGGSIYSFKTITADVDFVLSATF